MAPKAKNVLLRGRSSFADAMQVLFWTIVVVTVHGVGSWH